MLGLNFAIFNLATTSSRGAELLEPPYDYMMRADTINHTADTTLYTADHEPLTGDGSGSAVYFAQGIF